MEKKGGKHAGVGELLPDRGDSERKHFALQRVCGVDRLHDRQPR